MWVLDYVHVTSDLANLCRLENLHHDSSILGSRHIRVIDGLRNKQQRAIWLLLLRDVVDTHAVRHEQTQVAQGPSDHSLGSVLNYTIFDDLIIWLELLFEVEKLSLNRLHLRVFDGHLGANPVHGETFDSLLVNEAADVRMCSVEIILLLPARGGIFEVLCLKRLPRFFLSRDLRRNSQSCSRLACSCLLYLKHVRLELIEVSEAEKRLNGLAIDSLIVLEVGVQVWIECIYLVLWILFHEFGIDDILENFNIGFENGRVLQLVLVVVFERADILLAEFKRCLLEIHVCDQLADLLEDFAVFICFHQVEK